MNMSNDQLIALLYKALVILLMPECGTCQVPLGEEPHENESCATCEDARRALAECTGLDTPSMREARQSVRRMGAPV